MTAKEYHTKAKALLKQFTENKHSNSYLEEPNSEYKSAIDEFLHLVFFFNPEMPLYKSMQTPSHDSCGHLTSTKYFNNPQYYMELFIYYLEEYFDVF